MSASGPDITPAEAHQSSDRAVVLLDVREDNERSR